MDKKKKKSLKKWTCQVPFNSLSHPTPEQTLLQAGGVLMMSGTIADIRSNIPQHLAVASPPTIKSSLAPDTGADLCALAHSQPLCLYHTPTSLWQTGLISPAATLHPASKRTAVEKAPQGPLRMDSWIKHAPEASFLSPRSAQALIRHGSRELPTVTSPSFPQQKGTVLRSRSSERGPPSNTVTSHYVHTLREGATEKDRDEREWKQVQKWSMKDQIDKEGEEKKNNIPWCNAGQGVTRG